MAIRISRLLLHCSASMLCVIGLACSDSGDVHAEGSESGGAATSDTGPIQSFVILDRGLNMPIGTLKVPKGWRVEQDIATNTHTAQFERFLLDVSGPEGLIRGLGSANYLHSGGQNHESLAEAMVQAGLQGFAGLEFGEITANSRRMKQPGFEKNVARARARGLQMEALQAPFQATAEGRSIEGRVEVDHILYFESGQHFGGHVTVGLLISTPSQIDELIQVSDAIGYAFEPNPDYDGAKSRLIDAVAARQYDEHRQRMANNQAQFESHQRMMQGRYAAADQHNQRWLQNFRESGPSPSGGDAYGGHEKFLDAIGETTSFDDPNSGIRTRQDGQFDRWATDGQGNYIGSDDPNFDANALDGNWTEVEPLD